MIITKLRGGLGNQMFQYAAARSLAHRHGTEVKLDISFLGHSREYELDKLAVNSPFATREEIASMRGAGGGLSAFITSSVFGRKIAKGSVYEEPHFHFDSGLWNVPDNTYLDGYWQSERYFSEIEEIIRDEFRVRAELDGRNLRAAQAIRSVNAVSLHIRRKDYASCEITRNFHGLCPIDYYHEAVRIVTARIPSPFIFVFSDDSAWVRDNVVLSAPMIVLDENGSEKGWEDLRLMSLCQHHIIANSSFSWWGAWLNPNQDKIVIAPQRWFSPTNINTSDLLPPAWVRI